MRKSFDYALPFLIIFATFFAVRRLHLSGGGATLIIFFVVAAMMVWGARLQSRADTLRLQNAAAKFDFEPVESDEVSLPIYPLSGPGWVESATCGELRGLKALLFDYCIHVQGPPEMRNYIRQTVVAFRVDGANLPVFQIRPLCSSSIFDNCWKNLEGDWENSDDTICFPDALGFHQRFELMSSAEEGVRRHFNAKLLDTIAALNDCNCVVKGYCTTVLFFFPNKTIRHPDEMEAFVRKAADIAYAIFSTEKQVMAARAKSGFETTGAGGNKLASNTP
jgi:hypothetical protein